MLKICKHLEIIIITIIAFKDTIQDLFTALQTVSNNLVILII